MAMAVPGQHGCVLDSEQMRYCFFLVAVLKAWLQELELLRAEMEAARRGAGGPEPARGPGVRRAKRGSSLDAQRLAETRSAELGQLLLSRPRRGYHTGNIWKQHGKL